jgi:hypothetical protein
MAAERARRVAPRSGRQQKKIKMTTMHARHGPARPGMRRWLASFLIDMLVIH